MKHISILVPEGAILASLEGTRQLFTTVNQFCEAKGVPPLLHVQLVGLTAHTNLAGGLFTANPDVLMENISKTDLIIIPAIDGDKEAAIQKNEKYIPWILAQYKAGSEVASLCLGAFLLAATGLLNGKQCATHWMAANEFREMFPEVDLVTEKIVTDEQGIYSSGGAFSYTNLILYLIEKYAGREISILSAKVFAIEIERESQSPFIIFAGQKSHQDVVIKEAQIYIEENLHEKISIEELATKFSVGRRSFDRRFVKATGNTPIEYTQRVRIEAAKKSFETSSKNIKEVMYDTGYSDVKAFREVFRKITGLSPLEYRIKYNSANA